MIDGFRGEAYYTSQEDRWQFILLRDAEDSSIVYFTMTNHDDPEFNLYIKFKNDFPIEIHDPMYVCIYDDKTS